MLCDYAFSYPKWQQRKRLSLFLQWAFLLVGGLIIFVFTLLVKDEPIKVDALLSPLVQNNKEKKNYENKLLFADQQKILYKETDSNKQTLKLTNFSTYLSEIIAVSQRIGFIGFLDDYNFLFLKDEEGFGKFIVNQYNLKNKTETELFAFQAYPNVAFDEMDNLVAISPDKTKLAFAHESGIVLYTLKTEKEETILTNEKIIYKRPSFIDNKTLLVYQVVNDKLTIIILDDKGKVLLTLPQQFKNGQINPNGWPLVGIINQDLYLIDKNKTKSFTLPNSYLYKQTSWLNQQEIIITAKINNASVLLKSNRSGQNIKELAKFNQAEIKSVFVNPKNQTFYFNVKTEEGSTFNFNFYQIGPKDKQPISLFSISRNVD